MLYELLYYVKNNTEAHRTALVDRLGIPWALSTEMLKLLISHEYLAYRPGESDKGHPTMMYFLTPKGFDLIKMIEEFKPVLDMVDHLKRKKQ